VSTRLGRLAAGGGLVLSILGLEILMMLAALVIWAVGVDQPVAPDIVLFPAAFIAFGAVGALILARQPDNTIGQLALLTGAVGSITGLFDSVGRLAEPVQGQEWAAWIATWGFPLTLAPPLLLILCFPTGRLASPRWRIAAVSVVVGSVGVALGNAFTPVLVDYPSLPNPVGVEAFAGSPFESGGVAWFLVLAGAIASGLSLVTRLRHAGGIERQQLKWMTFAAAIQAGSWVLLAMDLRGTAGDVASYAVFGSLLLIPLAAGVAILRYRLYDIDLVIRRTLVYGALVAILGLVYVGLVIGLQAVLVPLTGGDTLPVALSTLAIAALFGPVRARVRALVDRRFYRSRYDRARLVASFGGRLRDETDLESVGRSLLWVADETVRPTTIALWVRPR
jgi:hypothetical protein